MVRDVDGEIVVRKPSRSRVIGQASVAGPSCRGTSRGRTAWSCVATWTWPKGRRSTWL